MNQKVSSGSLILIRIVSLVILGAVIIVLGIHFINKTPELIKVGGKTLVDTLPALMTREIIIDEFTKHIDKLEGMTYLQVAKISSTEAFVVKDQGYLMGLNILPDVKAMLTAPVEFTYYLDLKAQWDFSWDNQTYELMVLAPKIKYNMPAVDFSNSNLTVDGSFFRTEALAKDKLQKAINPLCRRKAQAKISFVKETARRSTEEFIQEWFVALRFHDSEKKPQIKALYFADETLPDEIQGEFLSSNQKAL